MSIKATFNLSESHTVKSGNRTRNVINHWNTYGWGLTIVAIEAMNSEPDLDVLTSTLIGTRVEKARDRSSFGRRATEAVTKTRATVTATPTPSSRFPYPAPRKPGTNKTIKRTFPSAFSSNIDRKLAFVAFYCFSYGFYTMQFCWALLRSSFSRIYPKSTGVAVFFYGLIRFY